MPMQGNETIAVIGLGYVGLPLAVAFGRHRRVIGFDVNAGRIAELQAGRDSTLEVEPEDLAQVPLEYTTDPERLREATVYIVTVPTPIDGARRPDLTPLLRASETIGTVLKPGDLVIYESTVYPGATEEVCVPVLERVSGLRYITGGERRERGTDLNLSPERKGDADKGFYCGYSPERINPGDREHRVETIRKVTSGSTPEAAERVDALYRAVITAGTHKASSIRVAEAAKVIENTQRDVNIALINELALIFNRLGIDTEEVLQAAGTKWNFLPFRPGLVGGHCIGVDPYYLVHKAMTVGYIPDIIRQAREINDGMARNVASRLIKAMIQRDLPVKGARVLLAGFTFKENCPDTRNTKVIDLKKALSEYGLAIDICDTWAIPGEVAEEYGETLLDTVPETGDYSAVVLTVPHSDMLEGGAARWRRLMRAGGVLFDIKAALAKDESDLRL